MAHGKHQHKARARVYVYVYVVGSACVSTFESYLYTGV